MSNLHKDWIRAAVAAGLARIENAKVSVKGVPNKGDNTEIAFEKVVFIIETAEQAANLMKLGDSVRGTTKNDDGVEVLREHPIAELLSYAYGLNCRAKVRADFERQFEDPDKALKKIAALLVKSGQFKNETKALAAARLMQEDTDDETEPDENTEGEASA